jgi:hypothetical protein
MIWALLSYIFFWVAFFCLVLVGLLYLAGRTQSDWLKRFSSRFGETAAETAQVRGILRRFGILFLAAGLLFLLLSQPTTELTPEEQGMLTLLEAACGLTIFWQIKGIRDLVKTPQGRSVRNR